MAIQKLILDKLRNNFEVMYYKSLKTGNEYIYKSENDVINIQKYTNHGYGGLKNGYMDLPADEYPYTLIKNHIKTDIKYIEVENNSKLSEAGEILRKPNYEK